jgi:3-oxoacyl-[acyl-carrier protein] reductase
MRSAQEAIGSDGAFRKTFAMKLGTDGITVNAIAPAFVGTDITPGNRSAAKWEAIERSVAERAMMGRIGQPEDIANAVAFVSTPESGWVTAQMLVVDGGRMDYIGHG